MSPKAVRLLIGIVTLALFAGLVAAACGGDDDTPTPRAAAAPTAAPAPTATPSLAFLATPLPFIETGEPVFGGHLRFASATRIERWDLSQNSSSFNLWHTMRHYNGVLEFSPRDMTTIIPDLAESWSSNEDLSVFTFKFREGITWHDGTPFDVSDVVFSLKRWANPPEGTVQPRAAQLRVQIKDVIKTGPLTMDIIINDPPQPVFLDEMAVGWHIIQLQKLLEGEGGVNSPADMIGTGPYTMDVSGTTNEVVKSIRNPNYFKVDAKGRQLPYLDFVTSVFISDSLAYDAAFRTQQIHFTDWVGNVCCGPVQAKALAKDLGDKVTIKTVAESIWYLEFNHLKPPFNDFRARKAVWLAIDRPKIYNLAFDGGFTTDFFNPIFGATEDVYSKWPGYGSPSRPEDLAEAKRLAEEVGLKEFKIHTANILDWSKAVTLIIGEMDEKLGIKVSAQVTDFGSYLTTLATSDYQAGFSGTAFTYLSPDSAIATLYLPTGGRNFGKWEFPQKWHDLNRQQSLLPLGSDERLKLLIEMDDIMRLEVIPVVPILYHAATQVWWNFIKNYTILPVIHQNQLRFDDIWIDMTGF